MSASLTFIENGTDAENDGEDYAANFSQDQIEVYTSHWRRIPRVWTRHGFVRPFQKPADIPANYVPFNIQSLNGLLYVAYAELIRPSDPDYDPEEPLAERTCGGWRASSTSARPENALLIALKPPSTTSSPTGPPGDRKARMVGSRLSRAQLLPLPSLLGHHRAA